MTHQETIIRANIKSASVLGVDIRRGACFDWCGTSGHGLPVACNWMGAVLLATPGEFDWKNGGPAMAAIRQVLRVDMFWVYRFAMGFDRRHVIQVRHDDGKREWYENDDVSLMALKMSKDVCA